MNNTLHTGDVVLVNKLKYGPTLPRSPFEIPWINIAFYFNDAAKQRLHEKWWTYKRLSGTSQIKHGDVVVFTMPFGNDMTIVKRCMALAGDTVKIIKGDVYINNKHFRPSDLVLNNYTFEVNDRKAFYKAIDTIALDADIERVKQNTYKSTLSFQEKLKLEHLAMVGNMIRITDSLTPKSTAYPDSQYNQWNIDDYGPYIIPKKEMKISLNKINYALYGKLINNFENVELKEIGENYYLNNRMVEFYNFKQNYYFMMGDNRKGSIDSRYWGLVPEERIIGKVQCVLWSDYQDGFQWDRLFKKVE